MLRRQSHLSRRQSSRQLPAPATFPPDLARALLSVLDPRSPAHSWAILARVVHSLQRSKSVRSLLNNLASPSIAPRPPPLLPTPGTPLLDLASPVPNPSVLSLSAVSGYEETAANDTTTSLTFPLLLAASCLPSPPPPPPPPLPLLLPHCLKGRYGRTSPEKRCAGGVGALPSNFPLLRVRPTLQRDPLRPSSLRLPPHRFRPTGFPPGSSPDGRHPPYPGARGRNRRSDTSPHSMAH